MKTEKYEVILVNESLLNSTNEYNIAKDYWKAKLNYDLNNTQMPYDYRNNHEFEKKEFNFTFTDEIYQKLIKISNNQDTALFVVLLTGINIFWYKYTGEENVSVGIPTYTTSDKIRKGNNILPSILQVQGNYTFKELLLDLKENVINGYKYQYYPIHNLLNKSYVEEEYALFKSICLLNNIHDFNLIEDYIISDKNDITFAFEKDKECIKGKVVFNGKLFKEETIMRMVDILTTVYKKSLEDVSVKINDIDILSSDDKEFLKQFNNTAKEIIENESIIDVFEKVVEKNLNNKAVIFENSTITYSELNMRANKLARYLRNNGIGYDDVIGVMFERSIDMVISILGVLKSGAAYLPIDPSYPMERMSYIIKDSSLKEIISNAATISKTNLNIDYLDCNNKEILKNEDSNLERKDTSKNLAYIIYTSGTTGRPKGVMIENRTIYNSIMWRVNEYSFTREDKILQLFSSSFDGFVTSFFTTILSGSTAVFVNDFSSKDPALIAKVIEKEKITAFICVPILYEAILNNTSSEQLKSLRMITLAGDQLSLKLIQLSKEKNKNIEIINEYGPTENSVVSTIKRNIDIISQVTIGKPISNVRIYILDKNNQIVPIGVTGEICIAGDGLARGYVNNQEMTEEKFIRADFIGEERLYKTGDLARWIFNGELEYLGRKDNQVKIRGFRIELDEIQKELMKYSKVKMAVVLVERNKDDSQYISAYIKANGNINASELKEFLNKSLPHYMIPSKLIEVSEFPLNINGKIDKRALIGSGNELKDQIQYVAPRSKLEEKIAQIWSNILNVDNISIDDDFFSMGGHSLQATQLINELYKEFNVDISLIDFFENPKIRFCTDLINASEKSDFESIETIGEREYYPVSAAQKRMFILNSIGADISYNMPGKLIIEGNLDKDKLENVVNKVIERHEILRTYFELIDNIPVQKIKKSLSLKIEHVKISTDNKENYLDEFIRPFDLSKAPLFRMKLIEVDSRKNILLFDMHHIIFDGVSSEIFVKEIMTLYNDKTLDDIKLQYKDFTVWQNSKIGNDVFNKQKEYWKNVFKGEIPTLNMPTDYIRPEIQSFSGENIKFNIDNNTLDKLKTLAQNTGTTLFMVLLSAYNILLHKYTGQKDIIVGTPISGRTHADLQNVIGLFVNSLAIRSFRDEEESYIDYLEEIKNSCLSAFNNQAYQFEELLDELNIERNLSRNPLFDTMFTIQKSDISNYDTDQLKFSVDDFDNKTAKFDIMLTAAENIDSIEFTLNYSTALFKKSTMERFSEHYINILSNILKDPQVEISNINMLSDEERNKVLVEFNNSKEIEYDIKTIVELFENKVQENPDKTSIVYKDEALRYDEFNKRVNQFARGLRNIGISKGSIIAIMMTRSFDMLIAIYATLKINAAYLPIDTECPKERLEFILNDSNAAILLTNKDVDQESNCKVINVKEESLYAEDYSNLNCEIDENDIAYIIYTSGSTGLPKGVVVEHKSLLNIIMELERMYNLYGDDAYLFKTSYTFDVSIAELFGWFHNGGKLVVLENGQEKNPQEIIDCIGRNKITHMNFVPSMLNAFMSIFNDDTYEKISSLKYVFAAGEALNVGIAEKFIKLLPNVRLENIYGPTEGTIYTTAYSVNKFTKMNSIPIGKPLSNIKTYILDQSGNLQGIGIPGELCISGRGVARGYLNRPELTRNRFVENNTVINGDRIYKTGDLVKWLPDGNIEYLGRIDNQVKIRGFRIELDEIESNLLKVQGISQAVVLPKKGNDGDSYLCAYYVASSEINRKTIIDTLSKELQDYMIPAYFYMINEIPLTQNGKVDKQKLINLKVENVNRSEFEEPQGEKEKIVADVWRQVLDIENISRYDDFFTLGGNSLKAISVFSKLFRDFDMQINDIYKYPVLNLLAKNISFKDSNIISKIDKALLEMKNDESLFDKYGDKFKEEVKEYEAKNDEQIKTIDLNSSNNYNNILVTGVTGFLGIHLLKKLLENTNSNIYLIIRAKDHKLAVDKLRNNLEFYFNSNFYDFYHDRIIIINGDLTLERLGLNQEKYIELSNKIDSIINSAANVKHYGNYEDFESINVDGVKKLLQFCKTGKKKDFYQISTLSLLEHADSDNQILFNEYDETINAEYDSVYLRSKYEAEKLIFDARNEGINSTILRIGNLVFDSQTGVFQKNITENAFYSLLRGIVRIGAFPNINHKTMEFTNVDLASEAIVKLISIKSLKNKTHHIFNPNILSLEELGKMFKASNMNIDILSLEEFLKIVHEIFESKDIKSEFEIALAHSNIFSNGNSRKTVTSSDRTNLILKTIGFEWKAMDDELANRMISYCKSVNFFENR